MATIGSRTERLNCLLYTSPSSVEDKHYKKWVDAGYFHAERDPDKRPYTIVMPPPNITGQLLSLIHI